MSSPDPKEIARSWLTAQRQWWAYETVCHLCESQPNEALDLVLELVNMADSSELLEDVGAGSLEDLLRAHGSTVIHQLEVQAANNAPLRVALSHVWVRDGTTELGKRLVLLGCQPLPQKSHDDV
jgi:hypothetical protein